VFEGDSNRELGRYAEDKTGQMTDFRRPAWVHRVASENLFGRCRKVLARKLGGR
jgi:hypothetical protein